MYTKKFVFSAVTLPALVFMSQASDFQARRGSDKNREASRRAELLNRDPVDITPKNGGQFPWSGKDTAAFEQEWSMRPVALKGVFDYDKEIQVEKMKDGEKGVEVITPFFTHLNGNEMACGIAVNRGWMPHDLKDMRYDKANSHVSITGVLYRGDAKTKYSGVNQPLLSAYKGAYPEELSVVFQLGNEVEGSQFMLKAVDMEDEARTPMPDVPSKADLQKFTISPERHHAYMGLWNTMIYMGVMANTAMWLYL
mmetsp:Transcript_9716/g.14800  ORF Transcript_9716/g.14800 Transcript_9716/m.14800 type:complete len:253 (-) Transcript_9716:106-864(-)|eukprot:CAMPEP_0170494946 /NCGR_PEP_ID=MMETSP0208-20121228/14929_1 /TAXON_ID=197538 /ORGANISM="Strombidium inclinatum, Strain S3" /LENGTH=252 /DNA_ID=CAMNT_0010771071 /DNA_START=13 /DNA_END=771 /DNA_ORIENTATION=+